MTQITLDIFKLQNNFHLSIVLIMKNTIITTDIQNLIYNIRGKAVMLDRDLAVLYQVETRALNQAVKRNEDRFPADFMFTLHKNEIKSISQSVISLKYVRNVHVFTEQGIAMLSSVLTSKVAIKTNIQIMRAFVQVRRMGLSIVDLKRKLDRMEKKYDQQFNVVFSAIRQIIEPSPSKKRKMGFTAGK